MKKSVDMSTYSFVLSMLSILVLGAVFYFTWRQPGHDVATLWFIAGVITLMFLLSLFYSPLSISVDEQNLWVNRSLRSKAIPLSEISDVRLCQPTMGERRIIGSGGWFGYWGWFRDGDLGRYFAYYGKASDCLLVTLRHGRKYMLGCKDSPEMVAAIKDRLGKAE